MDVAISNETIIQDCTTLNNASDYWTNGLYRTPKLNPHPNPRPLVR